MGAEIEQHALREALAYLTPDPASHGTISLRSDKARTQIDAIEAAFASHIAERDAAVKLAYDLKYAVAGGEDVPGSANAVTVEDVARWRDDAWQRTDALDRAVAQAEARALAAEAEITRLKEGMEARTKALGAAISRREWSEVEAAHAALRDGRS